MDDFMRTILSRVLSQEIGNQMRWKDEDIKNGFGDGADRDKNIGKIKEFMKQNGIEIRPDYF